MIGCHAGYYRWLNGSKQNEIDIHVWSTYSAITYMTTELRFAWYVEFLCVYIHVRKIPLNAPISGIFYHGILGGLSNVITEPHGLII